MHRRRLVSFLAFLVVIVAMRPMVTSADPRNAPRVDGRVCAGSPIAASEIEIRIHGASWCPACALLDRALEQSGDSDGLRLGATYGGALIAIRHVDVDAASEAELRDLRAEAIPEIHVRVRGRVLDWHEGAYADASQLRTFVESALSAGRCRVSR